MCPACATRHVVLVGRDPKLTASPWGFNGALILPTITPSIKVSGTEPLTEEEYQRVMTGQLIEPRPFVCHSQITNGKISYYDDCTHRMSGRGPMDLPYLD